jgi:hypothetical protein
MSDGKRKICFVVGPIGDPDSEARIHADWILEEIIQPVISQFSEFSVVRADQIAPPGMIDAQVIQHLLDSDLVIADLSRENPNAFYEIGIRHMAQKAIIHMQLADEKTPFDVSLYRTLKFSRSRPSDLKKARDELKRAVEAVLAEGYKVDNPVTRARGQIKIEQDATPEQRIVLEQLRAIQERLDILEEPRGASSRRKNTETILVETDKRRLSGPEQRALSDKIVRTVSKFVPIDSGVYDGDTFTIQVLADIITPASWNEIETSIRKLKGVQGVVHIPF